MSLHVGLRSLDVYRIGQNSNSTSSTTSLSAQVTKKKRLPLPRCKVYKSLKLTEETFKVSPDVMEALRELPSMTPFR